MALIRTQTARAIRAAREAGRLKPWHEVDAAIALVTAAHLDAAHKAGQTRDVVSLSRALRLVLAGLPLGEEASGEVGSGREVDASESVAPHPLGLAGIVGAGPKVGDTALPG